MYGQPEEALHWLAESAKVVEATQERCVEAEMDRLRGTLLLSKGEHATAGDSFSRALAVARRQKREDVRTPRRHRPRNTSGAISKRSEARDLLAPIYNWFTEGSYASVLQDAKALVDQLT